MHRPDTIRGVIEFCESEGQSADSVVSLLEAATAIFEIASRKGMWHVTGADGSDRLTAFIVPPDPMIRLGKILVDLNVTPQTVPVLKAQLAESASALSE